MTAPQDHRTLGRFAAVLSSLSREESLTARLCEAGRLMLDSAGSAMTLNYSSNDRLTVHATDDLAHTLEDLQDVVGEGPGHDAARTGDVVISRLPDPGDRWGVLAERLKSIGFAGTVLAIPLAAQQSIVGVMTLHREEPEREGDESIAKFLGITVGAALLQDQPISTDGDLTQAWESRAEIHQATGMVVAQVGVRPEDALALLRGHAFARASTLAEVAADVIERRINFRDFTIEGD